MRKRIFLMVGLVGLLLCGCSQYKIYSVKDDPVISASGGALFALPKTLLCVSVTVEKRDFSDAPYRDYACDYLGVSSRDVDSSFRLVSIDVKGVNVADPDQYYYVKVRRGSVAVDQRHLLLAIGMDNPEKNRFVPLEMELSDSTGRRWTTRAENNLYDRPDTFYTRHDAPGRPTLVSTKKDMRTTRQRAAAAAERLEEIQEKQQQLLNGEYEGSYGAEAVQYLYAQLRLQEERLIESFCGQMRSETVTFYVDPVIRRKEDFVDTIVWFSPTAGFFADTVQMAADAFPIVCSVHSDHTLRNANRFVKYHTSGFTSDNGAGRTGRAAVKNRGRKNFRYRVPEQTSVSVSTPVFSVSRSIPISQMGTVVELPRYRIRALFDAETLDLKLLDRR